ncbi:MAG: hypothetical protein M3Q71_11455 [Chloroflexota bacterium]|nr:hypothetical protein [Chloroflexota bacterium]
MPQRDTEEQNGTSEGIPHETRVPLAPDRALDLEVRNRHGNVLLRATDRDDLLVRSTKQGRHGSRGSAEATLAVRTEDDHRIQIRVETPSSGIGWAGFGFGRKRGKRDDDPATTDHPSFEFDLDSLKGVLGGNGVRCDVEIEIPRHHAAPPSNQPVVRVRTASGDVQVEDVTGNLNVATASATPVWSGSPGTSQSTPPAGTC